MHAIGIVCVCGAQGMGSFFFGVWQFNERNEILNELSEESGKSLSPLIVGLRVKSSAIFSTFRTFLLGDSWKDLRNGEIKYAMECGWDADGYL